MIDNKLLRATPRPVSLTVDGTIVRCLAFALLVGAALGSALLYVRAQHDAELVSRVAGEGVTTAGQVINIAKPGGREGRSWVRFQFEVDGAVRVGSARLSRRAASALKTGSTVTVHYLKSDPARNWINSRTPDTTPIWVAPLLFVSLALPAAILFFQIHKQRSLLAEGRPAEALVTGSKRVVAGNSPGYRVQYEFTSLSGKSCTGSSRARRSPAEIGSTITILYDRDEPHRSVMYPLPFVRVGD